MGDDVSITIDEYIMAQGILRMSLKLNQHSG